MNSFLSATSSRRQFLHSSGTMLGAAVCLPSLAYAAAATKNIPVGLELYSLRDQCKTDLPGMLATVAKIGYKGVEFAGYHNRTARELRKLLDDNGLVTCGTHTPYDSILPAKLDETIEFNRTIGNSFLIVPWMEGKSKQEWLDKAKLFDQVAVRLRAEKMFVGYHAHAHDFQQFEGQSAWDLFFGNTQPEVIMQLDTSNCREGGADPVAVLKKYPRRARTIHLKAFGGGPEAVIGEDQVDWEEVFSFCESKGGTKWYVVEHESSKDPVDAVRRSYEALKKMGKV